ncbi:transcriptional regulator [Streptomyces sp. CB01201]|uniref:helix-turn-helix domain-containing protein n=1 Tax=Streptomyces sp. CB01201 TaxID=2020324 RepID=UPI000C26F50B|nr:helix-turn-helix transcriptional regulator [Streptomyces sp. CB01201]PJM99471.1 transcriptional regulator [Streptomyces sp. CB01201]
MAIEDNPESRTSYGDELRRRREEAGLTQEELSVRAILSRSYIAHIEAGRRRPSGDDARRLDQVRGANGFFERFLPTLDGRKVAEHFEAAKEFEQQATVIREYAPELVPGILQTEAYARAVFQTRFPPMTDEECDKALVTRLGRSRILDHAKTPAMWVMLNEAVLRRRVGGPAVMAAQLRHLVDLGERRRIRLQVLPFGAGAHSLMEGMVSLMWFADLPPVVYVEGWRTGKLWELPSVVQQCLSAYDLALGDALSHQQSLALVRSAAEDYEHEAH